MRATTLNRWASTFHRGLERWDRWLQERLAPARVALTEWSADADGSCSWRVEYPLGTVSVVRIPRSLVESSAEDFQRATHGLGTYGGWERALKRAGVAGISLTWH